MPRRKVKLSNGHYIIPAKRKGKRGDTGVRRKVHKVTTPNGQLVDEGIVVSENHELTKEYEKVRRTMVKRYPPPHYYHFCDNVEGTPI